MCRCTMILVLERIYIKNYKCLADFNLQLQETTLLLGDNGSGKTAVLDVVYGLRQLLAGEVKITDPVAFPSSTLTRWQTCQEQQFELQVRLESESFLYRLQVEHDPGIGASHVTREELVGEDKTVLFDCNMGEVQLYRDDGSEGPTYRTDWAESALARVVEQPANTRLTSFLNAVRGTVVCTVRPHTIRSVAARGGHRLGRYADNFVGWYRNAVLDSPGLARSHEQALQGVMDGFESLRLERIGVDTRELRLRFSSVNGDRSAGRYWLRLDDISDGQRALVVLYGLLHLHGGDGVLMLLDEPDNYVALPEIQPWLMALLELCEETPSQAIICSHHPEIIDFLGPDYGLILRRNASGSATARPISQPALTGSLKLSELAARGDA